MDKFTEGITFFSVQRDLGVNRNNGLCSCLLIFPKWIVLHFLWFLHWSESENGYYWVVSLGLRACGHSEGVLVFFIYCSCLLIRLSSGWICYAEKTHGSFIIPYISTTKSPQQVMGSLIKGYFAEQQVRSIEQYLIYIPLCFTRELESKKLSCKLPAKAASPSFLHYLVRSWPLGQ